MVDIAFESTYKGPYVLIVAGTEFPLAEPIKLQVPSWTKWIAFDKDGGVFAYDDLPISCPDLGAWDSIELSSYAELGKFEVTLERWDSLLYCISNADRRTESPLREIMLGV